MSTAAYRQWVAAGHPVSGYAAPIADLSAVLRRYGYTVYMIGNQSHLQSNPPEDHTPFSSTGWPVVSPRWWVFACDIMPPASGALPTLAQLGSQLVADKLAGAANWIKYLNWTPAGGSCRHESWMPDHQIRPSGDVGHIHLSARTDMRDVSTGYDPVARYRHGAPAQPPQPGIAPPPFPGRTLTYRVGSPLMHGNDVRAYQQRLHDRRWTLSVDSWFGAQSAQVTREFQADSTTHGWPLAIDGQVGPKTWRAAFLRPVT